MNRVKREKTYLTRRIRDQITLTRREKGFNSSNCLENNSRNFSKNNYQGVYFKNKTEQNTTTPKGSDMPNNYVKNNEHKEPVKCRECQGLHYAKYYLNRKENFSNVHTFQEKQTIGDVENEIPRINASLENRQANHQTSMV